MRFAKPWLKPLVYGVGAVGLLVLGTWAWWQASENALRQDLAELRSLGFPTTMREEERGLVYYENRLNEYERASSVIGALTYIWEGNTLYSDTSIRIGREGDWRQVNTKEFKQHEGRFDLVIRALELAGDRRTLWAGNYDPGVEVPRAGIDASAIAQVVTAELIRDLQSKEPLSALKRLDLLIRLAEDLQASPFSTSYRSSTPVERQITIATTFLLREIRGDKALLRQLTLKLENRAPIPEPINAIKGDVARKIDMLLQPGELERFMASPAAKSLDKGFLFGSDLGRRIVAKRTVSDLVELVKNSPKGDWRVFQAYWSEVGQNENPDDDRSAMRFLLHKGLLSQPGTSYAHCLAYRRLALVGAKICLLQAEGGMPDSLDSFGDLAQDPLGAGPLKYLPSGGSFTLYSVGYDGTDNGGQNRNPKTETDIVVAVNDQKLSEGKV